MIQVTLLVTFSIIKYFDSLKSIGLLLDIVDTTFAEKYFSPMRIWVRLFCTLLSSIVFTATHMKAMPILKNKVGLSLAATQRTLVLGFFS